MNNYKSPDCQVLHLKMTGPLCASVQNESFGNDMIFDWDADFGLGVPSDFNLIF